LPETPGTVVLVPGLGFSGTEMALFAWRLRRRGYRTRTFRHFLWGGPTLPPGRDVGGVAGTVNVLVGWLLGLARPNDTVVSVHEVHHRDMRDTIVLPVSHTSMLLARSVVRCADAFLRTGSFTGQPNERR